MPSTKNIDTLAENVKLADYKGKWLILLFYPLDFTFVCPTELIHFSDRLDEFQGVGAEVLGVSTDSVHSHRAWLKTPQDQNGIEGVKYPIASDVGGQAVGEITTSWSKKRTSLFAACSSSTRKAFCSIRSFTI